MNNEKQPVILTIDDEKHIRESFRYFLEDYDYKVITAENGREGLEMFQRHSPDLVLLDLRMPELDGLDVLAGIKKQSPGTPVLVVSGTGVMADAVEALRLGAWDFLLKPIEDLTVLHHTVEKNLERSTDKRITIQTHLDAQMSTVFGNASQVQNAILNLGINARDAMPEGGSITISTENVTLDAQYSRRSALPIEPGPFIKVILADTGVGMSKEVQERIFEPFFTTKGSGRGTGLGLPSVYKMIRDHCGDIRVQSRQGEGTVFKLFFPVKDTPIATETHPTEEIIIYGSGRILVVDDESIIRSTTEALLKEMGYDVLLAEDGEAGVEIYRKDHQSIDMVLLDLIMPKRSGRDTYYALRKINPDVKVLLTSGFTLDAEKNELLSQGVMGLMPKPFNRTVLSKHIHRILSTPVTSLKSKGG